MLFLIEFVVVVLFPLMAVWAWRTGRDGRLWTLTAIVLLTIVAAALVLASPQGGNRIALSEGYASTAMRVMFFWGLTAGVPVIGSAVAVRVAGDRFLHSPALYFISIGAAVVCGVVGLVVAVAAFSG
jgi:hypothetical protein